MEGNSSKSSRVFRSREAISNILSEQRKSNLSVKAFCIANNIAAASFHNWKKKYGGGKVKRTKAPGFAALEVASSTPVEPALFAEVSGPDGYRVKFYQCADAAYLKDLLS